MNTLFTHFLTITFYCLFLLNPLFGQEKIKGSIEVDGDTRKYRLYLPSNYSSENLMPIVFNLHGITSDPGQQQLLTRMNDVAEENGFIVCYPKGKNRAWNVNFPFPSSKEDDVQFISELVDYLSQEYAVDLNRVYACGFSNGGYMSYKLACELSDKIVAVASVAGTFVPDEELNCNPEQTVPTLHIHGTADPIVRYKGSPVAISATDVVDFWRDKNNCIDEPVVTKIDNKAKLDLSRATRYDFGNCEDNAAVSFIKVKNGGHTWPGAKIITGVTNRDFSASEVIWEFFKQFAFEMEGQNRSKTNLPLDIEISPNPSFGQIAIRLRLKNSTTLTRSLYNLQGQQVLPNEQQLFQAGAVQWDYNLTHLPKGIYFLKVKNGYTIDNKKIVLR